MSLPLPPRELVGYVGDHGDDALASYLGSGRAIRERIIGLLPDGYDFTGRRVLDFGCGSGRALRHFLPEARVGDWHGADISQPCIDWVAAHLSPPIAGHKTAELPPLPFGDGELDLVYATSVFSHLTDSWAAWLLELRRILKPDGTLIATFMSSGAVREIAGEHYDERHYGMNVLGYGKPWALNGPMVLHSEWWLRAHWGRAFEIEALELEGFVGIQGVAVMRPKPGELTPDDLTAPEPDEPRELSSARHSIRQLHREYATLYSQFEAAKYRLGFYERIPGLRAARDLYKRFRR